jgi:hypothetical protein
VRALLQRTIYNRSWVLDIMVATLLIVTIMFLVGQRNQNDQLVVIAQTNRTLNQQNKDILQQIHDCTDPNGRCYKLGGDRSDHAIANINRVTLLAAYCASKTPPFATIEQVRKCIENGVAGKEPLVAK